MTFTFLGGLHSQQFSIDRKIVVDVRVLRPLSNHKFRRNAAQPNQFWWWFPCLSYPAAGRAPKPEPVLVSNGGRFSFGGRRRQMLCVCCACILCKRRGVGDGRAIKIITIIIIITGTNFMHGKVTHAELTESLLLCVRASHTSESETW